MKKITKIIILLSILAVVGGTSYWFASSAPWKIITTGTATTTVNIQVKDRLKDGLVGYWTMDGQDTNWNTQTTNDVSASGNNGAITGMSTTTSPISGVIGQALNFDGSTGYINAGTPNLGITDITECAWIYPKALSGTFMHYANSTDGDNLFLRIGGVTAEKLDWGDESGAVTTPSNASIPINTWTHICVTLAPVAGINNDPVNIYINGSLDRTFTANYQPFPANYLSIGSRGGGSNKFNGYIDEARIYNRALSASEVMDLYKMGAQRMAKSNTQQTNRLKDGLVGYWTMDGQDTNWNTQTTNDVSASGNNGAITGMSTTTSPISGVIGQALNFDGSNDYVSVANLGITTGDYTISLWAKLNVINANTEYVIGRNPQSRGIFMDAVTGNKWGLYDGSGSLFSNTATNVAGVWYHLVVTRTGTTYALYLNGASDGGGTMSEGIDPAQIYIGVRGDGVGYFNGTIDEARIYNRVLSASEVMDLYKMGVGI